MEEEEAQVYFRELSSVSYSHPFEVDSKRESSFYMGEADNSSVSGESKPPAVETKKKRNSPGMRDPDAEVIALSPKALMATNRFVCEICNKGFQRDQNLQLHRRGHNLPWKLRQRSSKEIRKRVYICPEPTCVHHDPSRALGDLTGIKKHFCRKHGEKKHRCDRCSKKYAVMSDLKAHIKTCGTREYRCDCGTLFSRRDSFITHRAFCDALAQETARSQPVAGPAGDLNVQVMGPPLPTPPALTSCSSPLNPSTDVLSPVLSVQCSAAAELPGNHKANFHSRAILIPTSSSSTISGGGISDLSQSYHPRAPPLSSYSTLLRPISDSVSLTLSPSLYRELSSFPGSPQNPKPPHHIPTGSPSVLSATGLLHKASQIGTSNPSFLHIIGMPTPAPFDEHDVISTMGTASVSAANQWDNTMKLDFHNTFPSSLSESILRQSPLFIDKPDTNTATLDFLGLGMGNSFLNSINGSPYMSSETAFSAMYSGIAAWDDDSSDRKPSVL